MKVKLHALQSSLHNSECMKISWKIRPRIEWVSFWENQTHCYTYLLILRCLGIKSSYERGSKRLEGKLKQKRQESVSSVMQCRYYISNFAYWKCWSLHANLKTDKLSSLLESFHLVRATLKALRNSKTLCLFAVSVILNWAWSILADLRLTTFCYLHPISHTSY